MTQSVLTLEKIIGSDVWFQILDNFDAYTLCQINTLSKKANNQPLGEFVWKKLCVRRWKIKEKVKRTIGASTWKTAYQIMSWRQRLPHGIYIYIYSMNMV